MAFRASPRTKILLAGLSALMALSAPVRAAEPSPAAIETANKLIVDLGLKQSLDVVVPALFGEFEKNVLATRPELKDPLHQALLVLVPEFNKGEPAVLADVARVMATKLSESELKEVLAFYESPDREEIRRGRTGVHQRASVRGKRLAAEARRTICCPACARK